MTQEKVANEKVVLHGVEYVRADSVKKARPPVDENGYRYAIVRSREQGVMCGYVKEVNGRCVTLLGARQLYYYSSKFVLPDIAEFGLTTKFKSKLSCAMSEEADMLEACGILYCTAEGARSLIEYKAEDHG